MTLFFLRFMLGFSEAPSFPANARIVAAWFPTRERGTRLGHLQFGAIFFAGDFLASAGWLTYTWCWEHVFTVMGAVGFVLTVVLD